MIALLADVISWACIIVGAVFAIIGAVGILRLPDVFSRMHGAGIIDTLGAGLILIGLEQRGENLEDIFRQLTTGGAGAKP